VINIVLLFVWFVVITIIPGLSILSLLFGDFKRFGVIELLVLAIGVGISYLVIVCYLLDLFLIINLITLTISILPFPCLMFFLYHKEIFHLYRNIKNKLKRDTLRKDLLIKLKLIKINTSTIILMLVLFFIVLIELNDLLKSIVVPVSDTWFWLIESKKIVEKGHLIIDLAESGYTAYGYFIQFPRGAAYFLAAMFLPNLINPYYIILFIGPFLSLLQSIGVYIASKKFLNSDKLAIYSVLLYGTSRLVIWRGKIYTTESIGLFLIIVLGLFLFEKNLKADILGLFVVAGLGLTSFSSFGPIILPTLVYFVLYKPYKVSALTIVGLIGGSLLLPSFAQRLLRFTYSISFNTNISLLALFRDNTQWTFGYSLAFAFIGVIYFLLNRSSERMFYVICFLETFVLINFINASWQNIRIFPSFSIFASTLAAQGLWSMIKTFRKVKIPLCKKGYMKSYIIHFIIVICLVYQIFFGMVRGYHATLSRRYNSEDVTAALWLYDNSPEDTVVLLLTGNNRPYSTILYPRTLISDRAIYGHSPENVVSYCSQNNVSYIILENDAFAQSIKANDHFTEIYLNSGITILFFHQ